MTYTEKLKDPRWQKKRLEIQQERGWKCQICSATKNTLHIHHTEYGCEPWDIDNDNLFVLCEYCHKNAHTYKSSIPQMVKIKFNPDFMELKDIVRISLSILPQAESLNYNYSDIVFITFWAQIKQKQMMKEIYGDKD